MNAERQRVGDGLYGLTRALRVDRAELYSASRRRRCFDRHLNRFARQLIGMHSTRREVHFGLNAGVVDLNACALDLNALAFDLNTFAFALPQRHTLSAQPSRQAAAMIIRSGRAHRRAVR